jgi:hypothetical protein
MIYIPWVIFGLGLLYLIRTGFKEKHEQQARDQRRFNLAASAISRKSATQAMNQAMDPQGQPPGLGQVPFYKN